MDGTSIETNRSRSSSSSGSLLHDSYELFFGSNGNSCASEFERSEILNNISVQLQRQFSETTAQFAGCESEEIEFGMSAFSKIYTKMDMENLFAEESVKQSEFSPSEQWHPSSLSSSQRSLTNSPESSSLLKNTRFPIPIPDKVPYNRAAPSNTATVQPHLSSIQASDQYRNIKFPTMKIEDMIITSAISAIFSSNPSTSSILDKPLRKVQTNQSLGNCDSGFKPYNSAIPPKSEPKKRSCGQKMIKDSIAYLRKINSMRDEAANQESQPTRHQLHHMISERKRREKLNKSFYELSLLLPPCSKDKASVLCKTKDYLKILEAQIFELEKKNQKLEMNLVPTDETEEDVSRSICSKNVQIVEAFEPMIGIRQIVLKITVRLECDLVKLVLHALEYLKEIRAISLVSLYADTNLQQMVQFTRATLKFDIKGSKLPPGSFRWCPFLGQTLSFIAPHRSSSRGQFLDESIKKYGKIFRSHLFGHPTVVSCDAEFNSFILQNEDRLFHAGYPTNIPGVLGDRTLLFVTGDVHKRLRGFSLNLFATVKTPNGSFLSDIEDNVLRVMEPWKDKKTLAFAAETRKFTFGVIVKQILSVGFVDPDAVEILKNFTTFMKGLVSAPINLPGTPYAKAIQARHQIQEKVKKIRQKRDKEEKKTDRKMDFLDVLITQANISEEEVSSLVLDLLLGGYETTSMLIAIIVKFLGENPNSEILKDLREEHLSVNRSKNVNGRLGWDDYNRMQFTQCLINEALRLGNVVKFVHRQAIKPIQYKGYEIPAGWKVLPILSSIHLDPSLYTDPLKFDPYRWQNVDAALSKKKFMPFGGGKRLCPGSELARLETSFFIHHLVLNYSWTTLMEEDWPMHYPYLGFKNELQVAITPLSPAS